MLGKLTTVCLSFFILVAAIGYLLHQEAQTYYQQKQTLYALSTPPLAKTRNPSDARLVMERQLEKMRQEFRLNTIEVKNNIHPHPIKSISEISISFTATYDGDVYRFLDALPKELNGQPIPKSFELKRTNKLTKAILTQIKNGQVPTLIEGQIVLYWIQPPDRR